MAGESTAMQWVGAVVAGIIVLVIVLWLLSWLGEVLTGRRTVNVIRGDTTIPSPAPVTTPSVVAPSGWTATRTYGLTTERARACPGRIVVDVNSPLCVAIPPRVPGGPPGRRCPNVCVR